MAKKAQAAKKAVSKKTNVKKADSKKTDSKMVSKKVELGKVSSKKNPQNHSEANSSIKKTVKNISAPLKSSAKSKSDKKEKLSEVKSSPKNPLSKHTQISKMVRQRSADDQDSAADGDAAVKKKNTQPLDQGDLLIEKAREEMASINAEARLAEKASKVKPIKIERGNLADEKSKWQELFKRHGKEKVAVYKMTDVYESLKPIQHKVLGWGFILTNENHRLEVLFENGIKMLISNYKPS